MKFKRHGTDESPSKYDKIFQFNFEPQAIILFICHKFQQIATMIAQVMQSYVQVTSTIISSRMVFSVLSILTVARN